MAIFEFKLPDIGEGVREGEIVEWHVKPGDRVSEHAPMVEVMTDKATVTIGAPRTGTVEELRFEVGTTAQVGDVLVVLTVDSAVSESRASAAPSASGATAASAVGDIREGLPGARYFARATAPKAAGANGGGGSALTRRTGSGIATASGPAASAHFDPKPLATPATRRLAREIGVDLRRVRPTGPGGRVTRRDVEAASGVRESTPAVRTRPGEPGAGQASRRPFVGIRRKIAERMVAARESAVHFTFVEECHVDRLVDLREELAPTAEQRGLRLTFLPFIAKAAAAALGRHPALNSMLDEAANELVYRKDVHIGIATATDQGLVVPVIRNAEALSLLELAAQVNRLGEAARAGRLAVQDLSGSTFTITSLGKLGGLLATPILNYPEVAILGVHRIRERPVVRDGSIVVGRVMNLSLSFDHRIVDGHAGAAFAYDLIEQLERPAALLL